MLRTLARFNSAPVAAPAVRLLGDAILKQQAAPITDVHSAETARIRTELHAALAAFRSAHGFGRAISAPQIGASVQMIALDLGHRFTMINPQLTNHSPETFTMWDDCMSFPEWYVRVRRHVHVDCSFLDATGKPVKWKRVPQDLAELLQHEVDHLHGLTSFDRIDADGAGGRESAVVSREEWMRPGARAALQAQVSAYCIQPTIGATGPHLWLAQQMQVQGLVQ